MAVGDEHSWTLPGDEGVLVLRELGPEEIDAIAVQTARRARDDTVAATIEQRKHALVRSIVRVGSRCVSSEMTSEEVYHSLTARERKLAKMAWRSLHEVDEDVAERVLSTQAAVGDSHRFRWYLDPEVPDLEAAVEAIERAVQEASTLDDAAAVEKTLEHAREELEQAQAASELVMRELGVSEVDRIGEDILRRGRKDPWSVVAEELRDLLAASLVRFRGEDVVDGLASYRSMTAIERDLAQRCWHAINNVSEDEAVAFLGSRGATS
jgi:hypothetical protein